MRRTVGVYMYTCCVQYSTVEVWLVGWLLLLLLSSALAYRCEMYCNVSRESRPKRKKKTTVPVLSTCWWSLFILHFVVALRCNSNVSGLSQAAMQSHTYSYSYSQVLLLLCKQYEQLKWGVVRLFFSFSLFCAQAGHQQRACWLNNMPSETNNQWPPTNIYRSTQA